MNILIVDDSRLLRLSNERTLVKAGHNVVVSCLTTSIDSRLQADLMVIGPDGKPLATNRGYRDGDAVLDFKAPAAGEYLIRVAPSAKE